MPGFSYCELYCGIVILQGWIQLGSFKSRPYSVEVGFDFNSTNRIRLRPSKLKTSKCSLDFDEKSNLTTTPMQGQSRIRRQKIELDFLLKSTFCCLGFDAKCGRDADTFVRWTVKMSVVGRSQNVDASCVVLAIAGILRTIFFTRHHHNAWAAKAGSAELVRRECPRPTASLQGPILVGWRL